MDGILNLFLVAVRYFFYLEPKKAIINDINSKLISFYLGVKDDFDTLKKELSEIERIYAMNRRNFEELKSKTPTKRVEDENEFLYYQIRNMFNGLTEKNIRMLYFIFS